MTPSWCWKASWYLHLSLFSFFLRFLVQGSVLQSDSLICFVSIISSSLNTLGFTGRSIADNNLETVSFIPLLKTSKPSATARLVSCWEVYCSFGAIPQITWCKHSFWFWSRHLSHPTRNYLEPRWSNIGCINLTTDSWSGFLIGTWKNQIFAHPCVSI